MKRHWRLLQVGALAAVLVAGALPAAAQHTDRRGGGGDGGARARSGGGGGGNGGGGSNTPSRGRASDGDHRVESAPPSDRGAQNDGARQRRDNPPNRGSADAGRDQRDSGSNDRARDNNAVNNRGRDQQNNGRDNNRGGWNNNPNDGRYNDRRDADRRNDGRTGPPTNYAYRRDPRDYRRDGPYYGVPRSRILPGRRIRPHVYGPGGNLSLYFGWGTGYRYGSPYYGRVYGYSEPVTVYDARRYYGDVRLMVSPRWASVYVDGYYAGVVDDFDGFFQRLTVEVGPHEIEIDAPGYEPQYFDVYVDPERTIELRGDLYPMR